MGIAGIELHDFEDATAHLTDPPRLRQLLDSRGYLLLRGLLPVAKAAALADQVTDVARQAGWLIRAPDGREVANDRMAWSELDPRYREVHRAAWSLEDLHRYLHEPAAVGLIGALLDTRQVLVHPRKVLRMVFPSRLENSQPRWHQDYPEIQGAIDTLTLWSPLRVADADSGVLAIVPRSNRQGVLPLRLFDGAAGWQAAPGAPIKTAHVGRLEPGDALVFSSLTVHAATANQRDALRLSVDCRYQRARDPINETTLDLVSEVYGWPDVYSTWQNDELKYYWRAYHPKVVAYDTQWDAWREQEALAAGSRGDPVARRSLEIVATFGRTQAVRTKAAGLLADLNKSTTT